MANVQVIQRHAHLAGGVKLEFVNGREGKIAKAVLTAISNSRRGSGDSRSPPTFATSARPAGSMSRDERGETLRGRDLLRKLADHRRSVAP